LVLTRDKAGIEGEGAFSTAEGAEGSCNHGFRRFMRLITAADTKTIITPAKIIDISLIGFIGYSHTKSIYGFQRRFLISERRTNFTVGLSFPRHTT
jgi:hypothetical protein